MLASKCGSHTGSRPIVSTASLHKMADVNNRKARFLERMHWKCKPYIAISMSMEVVRIEMFFFKSKGLFELNIRGLEL